MSESKLFSQNISASTFVVEFLCCRLLTRDHEVLCSEMKVLNQEQAKLNKNITALKDAVQKKEDILYNNEFELGEYCGHRREGKGRRRCWGKYLNAALTI